ncbi:MAG: sel1 repeat family protein [Rhodocyclaceae bacterium]|nr:sel1 repeat family protein [Rhodocyclaceae bacterium]
MTHLKSSSTYLVLAFVISLVACSKAPTIEEGKLAYESNDYAKAIKIFTPLAETGNLEAQLQLGSIYMAGPFAKNEFSDSRKSFFWYSKAAEQGDENAQHHLGFLYESGEGIEKNQNRAFDYWEKAANHGGWDKQTFIAKKYLNEKRYKDAARWYLRLAEQDDTDAQTTICSLYLEGNGVHQDFQQALEWCNKAAVKGDEWSLHLLGTIYAKGQGVQADSIRAHMYFNLSRAGVFSKIEIAELEMTMSKAQIIEAQMLARNWVASHKGTK